MSRKNYLRRLVVESLATRVCLAADAAVEVAPAVTQVQDCSAAPQASQNENAQQEVAQNQCMDANNVDQVMAEGEDFTGDTFLVPFSGSPYVSPSTGVQNDYNDDGRPDDLPDDIPYEVIPSEGEGEPPSETPSSPPSVVVIGGGNTTITTYVTPPNVVNLTVVQPSIVCSGGGSTVVNNYYSCPSSSTEQEEPEEKKKEWYDPEVNGKREEPKVEKQKEEPKAELKKPAPKSLPKVQEAPCKPQQMPKLCPPPVQHGCEDFFFPTAAPVREEESSIFVAPMAAVAVFALPTMSISRGDKKNWYELGRVA